MPKRIIQDIGLHAQKIVDLIGGSRAGHQQLDDIFAATLERYIAKGYRQGRVSEFKAILDDLREYQDSTNTLLHLLKFISAGEWKSNSANTLLMLGLLNAVCTPSKDEPETYLINHVVEPLKDAVTERIHLYVANQKLVLKQAEANRQELESQRQVIVEGEDLDDVILLDSREAALAYKLRHPEHKVFCLDREPMGKAQTLTWRLTYYDLAGKINYLPLDNELRDALAKLESHQLPNPKSQNYDLLKVRCNNTLKDFVNTYLFSDSQTASEFSLQHPEQYCFSLVNKPIRPGFPRWHLTWFDMQGKPNSLAIDGELNALLFPLKDQPLPLPTTKLHYELKVKCTKVVAELVDKVQILINPEERMLRGLVSTYVLTQKESLGLTWYDSLGIAQEIALAQYPALHDWLESKVTGGETLTDKDSRLKTYLLNINNRREVSEVKQDSALKSLQRLGHGASLIATNDLEKVLPFRLIPGTYFLLREPMDETGKWVLKKRLKGKQYEIINTDSWELFHEILGSEENRNKLPEALEKETIDKIRSCITHSARYVAPPREAIEIKKIDQSKFEDVIAHLKQKVKKLVKLPGKIDKSHFSDLIKFLERRAGNSSSASSTSVTTEESDMSSFARMAESIPINESSQSGAPEPVEAPRKVNKINVDNLAIAKYFGHKPKQTGGVTLQKPNNGVSEPTGLSNF